MALVPLQERERVADEMAHAGGGAWGGLRVWGLQERMRKGVWEHEKRGVWRRAMGLCSRAGRL
eukprot:829419-Rhodomonas_salina.2